MSTHFLVDFPTACGNVSLVVHETSGWTNSKMTHTDPLEISGAAVDTVVQWCDGPLHLSDKDDDDDDDEDDDDDDDDDDDVLL